MVRLAQLLLAFFLISFLSTGCVADSVPETRAAPASIVSLERIDVNLYVDTSFTEEEDRLIVMGAVQWTNVSSGMVAVKHFRSKPGAKQKDEVSAEAGVMHLSVTFHKASSADRWVQEWDARHVPFGVLGILNGVPFRMHTDAFIVEDRMDTSKMLSMIAAHEFGHAIGIRHVDGKHSVMSAEHDYKVDGLTEEDVEAFCNTFECHTPATE